MFFGIGLKSKHYNKILAKKLDIDFVEIHAENFILSDDYSMDILLKIKEKYKISLHCIALSLGSACGINIDHLHCIKNLISTINPFLVSDHLSWNRMGDLYLPDLLPMPYNDESLDIFSKNVDFVQNFLQRQILIENPSSYFEYNISTYSEFDFLNKVCKNTGAGMLLDVNNIFVSCYNNSWSIEKYIENINHSFIKELHLAGHCSKILKNDNFKIDTHDNFVENTVWDIYQKILKMRENKNISTLIEWDSQIPELNILLDEVGKAKKYEMLTQIEAI